jgi:YesN/AraC family two-component response regulator
MRVLIVNDEPPVRATVHMLSSLSDFEPVGEAANGMEACNSCKHSVPPWC